MSNLIDLFLRQLTAEEKRVKTLEQYGNNLRRVERWLQEHYGLSMDSEHIKSITGLHLSEFYQTLHARELQKNTRNAYVTALQHFFGYLVKAQVITTDPSQVLTLLSVKKRRNADDEDEEGQLYTDEQLSLLMEYLQHRRSHNALRDTAMVALLLGSGLRAFELCSLNISDAAHIKQGVIRVERKGGVVAKVNIADFVYDHIHRYLLVERYNALPSEPLFLTQKGCRMTPNALWRTLSTKQREIGLDTGVHRFRHTFLSAVERNPHVGTALARDLAGHSSVKITDTYLHTTAEERQEAVNQIGYARHLAQ